MPSSSFATKRRSLSQGRFDSAKKQRQSSNHKRSSSSNSITCPQSYDGASVATVEKCARRRRLSRSSSARSLLSVDTSKENEQQGEMKSPEAQGPTPYYKVAQERGSVSPRKTRSASKQPRRASNRPPMLPHPSQKGRRGGSGGGGGLVLNFSPPDRKKIEAMERAKEEERSLKIEANRKRGQLLVFSPSGRPLTEIHDDDDAAAANGEDGSSIHSSISLKSGTEVDCEDGSQETTSPLTSNEKDSQDQTSVSVVATLAIRKIEGTVQAMANQTKQSDAKAYEASQKLIAMYEQNQRLLQADLEAAKTQSEKQCSDFQETKLALQNQIDGLSSEKKELMEQVNELNQRLKALDQASQKQNLSVADELNELKTQRDELQAIIGTYKAKIESLETEASEAAKLLKSKEEVINQLKQTLDEFGLQVESLKAENSSILADAEKLRFESQLMNELKADLDEKNKMIGDLFKQLGDGQIGMKERQAMMEDAIKQKDELNAALNDAMGELERVDREQAELKLAQSKLTEQAVHAEAERKTVLQQFLELKEEYAANRVEKDHLETQVAGLRSKGTDKDHRLLELDRQLQQTRVELAAAQKRLVTFDARESALFEKLQACDRVRQQLQSRVMQLSGNIRVFVRVRPKLIHELEQEAQMDCKTSAATKSKPKDEPFRFPGIYDNQTEQTHGETVLSDDITKQLIFAVEPFKDRGGLSQRKRIHKFGFDNVFTPNDGQDVVWQASEPLVQSAIDGYNVTFFAYGQTGSGKTHTMLGDDENVGLIGRSVSKLFTAKRFIEEMTRGEANVKISVELLEVYNDDVRDLLGNGKKNIIQVTSKEVTGQTRIEATTEEEVKQILSLAQSRRCVKSTSSNAESSRSHMLFTIHFDVMKQDGVTQKGKLNICDLAGSERLDKSGANTVGGALLEETKHINSSLSVLSNVIAALQKGEKHIPYRDSKLTFLLKDSLGGNSKTLAIVCCNPLASHFHESLCSLKFADKVNKVELKAVANFSC